MIKANILLQRLQLKFLYIQLCYEVHLHRNNNTIHDKEMSLALLQNLGKTNKMVVVLPVWIL